MPFAERRRFRIGINSGPAVAGVIDRKKLIYDLWGNAVNVASRMESHGQSGTIQITRAAPTISSAKRSSEPYGRVDVKGAGKVETWHVIGERI